MALPTSSVLAIAVGLMAGSALGQSDSCHHHHDSGIHWSGSSNHWSWNVNLGGGFTNNTGWGTSNVWTNNGSWSSNWIVRDPYHGSSMYSPYQPGYPLDGLGPRIDPALLPGISPVLVPAQPAVKVPPPPPPTTLELAQAATLKKNFTEAKKYYKEHLKAKADDMEVTRQLALCLIENKELDDGAALLREAYRRDPTLADRPYEGKAAGQDETRLLNLVTQLTPYASKSKLPSGWLAVTVAMQAQGKNTNALKMLERAKEGGLEREVYDRFVTTLKPKPKVPATSVTQPTTTPVTAPAGAPVQPLAPAVVAPGTSAPAAPIGTPLPAAPKPAPAPDAVKEAPASVPNK